VSVVDDGVTTMFPFASVVVVNYGSATSDSVFPV
jgi:hypothetical protein